MDDPVMNTKYQKHKYKVKQWEKQFKEKNGRVPSKVRYCGLHFSYRIDCGLDCVYVSQRNYICSHFCFCFRALRVVRLS